MLVQNTVERSSSTIVRRWMSAVPSALSVKMTAKPEKTSTIAASPQSSGASSRARISATTMRETWSVSCDPAFQATPLRIRDPIESVMLPRRRFSVNERHRIERSRVADAATTTCQPGTANGD